MKIKKIKSSWKEYFNFSARERRGVFFLACILIIQIAFLFYLRSITTPIIPPDPGIIKLLLESVDLNDSTNYKPNLQKSILKEKISLFYFDPNSTIEKSWLKLGVNENQIRVIKNYLSKGGRFRIKSDFKKMYCISSEKYTELRPYLLLPDSINKLSPIIKWKKITKNIIVDIESADTSELMTLKGIGPTYAKRIVNYREKLGGFYSIEQLKEVYGITDSLFQTLQSSIELKRKIPFRFIHLNTDSFSTLASHPYIKGKVAGLVCNYRKQHKTFTTLEELKQLPLITEENFLKLAPYLLLE